MSSSLPLVWVRFMIRFYLRYWLLGITFCFVTSVDAPCFAVHLFNLSQSTSNMLSRSMHSMRGPQELTFSLGNESFSLAAFGFLFIPAFQQCDHVSAAGALLKFLDIWVYKRFKKFRGIISSNIFSAFFYPLPQLKDIYFLGIVFCFISE